MSIKYEPCDICNERDDYNPDFCDGCVFDLRGKNCCNNTKCKWQKNGQCNLGLRSENCKAHTYTEEEDDPNADGQETISFKLEADRDGSQRKC